MPVTTPTQANFLYRIEAGSNTYLYTKVAENQFADGEEYIVIGIDHSSPTISGDAQQNELDLTIHENNPISNLFVIGLPPYSIKLRVYEYDRVADTVTPHWRGYIVRPSFDLDGSIVGFRCKTAWHFFERESFSDSLSALSRYSIFDPRSGVDIEALRTGIVVEEFNDLRDVIRVTGITQPDFYFRGGLIVAPDRDMRTILEHETLAGDIFLTLSGAFPLFSLDTGFTADIYPGDDLTYETWANKLAAATNNGELHGGWPFMPNVDPVVKGLL